MHQFWRILSQIHFPSPIEVINRWRIWLYANWQWWSISAAVHVVIFTTLAIFLGFYVLPQQNLPPAFESVQDNAVGGKDMPVFDVGDAPLDPSTLDTESLTQFEKPGQTAQHNDDSDVFEEAGGGVKSDSSEMSKLAGVGGFDVKTLGEGPLVTGLGGVGSGEGLGVDPGVGGAGVGIGGRGSGHRDAILGAMGGTKQTERAVAAGLNWIARHQKREGNWSINYRYRCKDKSCSGVGSSESDAGATGMALLAFFAAGQTHMSKGLYQETIKSGVNWLVKNQDAKTGDLSAGSKEIMYSHGIAAIALCEAYGMTHERRLAIPAQKAVDFIERAQNPTSGGWRYNPGDVGDTSVFGWQVMALKSAQMAGLRVNYNTFSGVEKWLRSVARGEKGGLFCYVPEKSHSPSMTAVGLLCNQYLKMRPDSPAMIEGSAYIMQNLPRNEDRDIYYWYYGAQTMHNLLGPDWDKWNRAMRRTLIETQARSGCAMGSWDPDSPTADAWGPQGGRHMLTCFSVLSLEVYYRYLPLYQYEPPHSPAPKADEKKPDEPKKADEKTTADAPSSRNVPLVPRLRLGTS